MRRHEQSKNGPNNCEADEKCCHEYGHLDGDPPIEEHVEPKHKQNHSENERIIIEDLPDVRDVEYWTGAERVALDRYLFVIH